MSIKGEFVRDLIDELNDINERQLVCYDKRPIDVPYVVSVIDQQIEKCREFIDDITEHSYYINGFERNDEDYYSNGKIRILIEKPDSEKESEYMVDAYYDYCYYIEFTEDERSWGYCQCTPNDPDYNKKHDCCGHGCDWTAPAFRIEKTISLGSGSWNGDANDYWKYEDKFKQNEKNKNNEVEKYKKEQEIKYIQNQIAELKKKLEELD